jgi:hypothetical protein
MTAQNDERLVISDEYRAREPALVETMMTADGLRLTTYGSGQIDAPGLER